MNIKTVVGVATALLLAGLSTGAWAREVVANAGPTARSVETQDVGIEALVAEDLTSGASVDVYRVVCTAECIRADVSDIGPFFDAVFKVSVNGSTNGFVGSASAISPKGSLSLRAEVCSGLNVDRVRRAFVEITQVNAAGAEDYDTSIQCRKADGTLIDPTIVKILDQ